MERNKLLLYLIGILFLIFLLILLMAFRDGNECISNPLTYGADKMSGDEQGDFSCICRFDNPLYEQVYFDGKEVTTLTDYID